MAELPKSQPSAYARGRRRRSRAFPILIFVFTAIVLAWFFESQATTTVIFVRHADTELRLPVAGSDASQIDDGSSGLPGPTLTARGRVRAELLADFLEAVDVVAGVDAIYATAFPPTRETAAPLADRLGLEVGIANPYEHEAFMENVLRTHKGDIVLVVTHADTIAPLIEELHGSKHVPEIAPAEYDNIYVVSIPWFGKVKTLRLRYGLAAPLEDIERYLEAEGGPQTQIP